MRSYRVALRDIVQAPLPMISPRSIDLTKSFVPRAAMDRLISVTNHPTLAPGRLALNRGGFSRPPGLRRNRGGSLEKYA